MCYLCVILCVWRCFVMSEKKRINSYVDLETYNRLKKVLDIMGITFTDFVNQAMKDFLDNMEEIVLKQDKEAFLKMMSMNIDTLQQQVKEELEK